jgi:hypothetical protein
VKAYRIVVLVIDHDYLGSTERIAEVLEHANYPNDCISPRVLSSETADIGEWSDDHPLNRRSTRDAALSRLFPATEPGGGP